MKFDFKRFEKLLQFVSERSAQQCRWCGSCGAASCRERGGSARDLVGVSRVWKHLV